MKNAYVKEHHHGDNGTVSEGMILPDISDQRFGELEKRGLVREATEKEVKEGHKPTIDADESKDGDEKQAGDPANKAAPKPANKAA